MSISLIGRPFGSAADGVKATPMAAATPSVPDAADACASEPTGCTLASASEWTTAISWISLAALGVLTCVATKVLATTLGTRRRYALWSPSHLILTYCSASPTYQRDGGEER